MSKKHNIGKRSDMQRFHRDMMKKIDGIAEEKAKSIYVEYTPDIELNENVFLRSKAECPNCYSKIPAMMGYSICPICKGTICVTSQTLRF